jgi:hypothetical protein
MNGSYLQGKKMKSIKLLLDAVIDYQDALADGLGGNGQATLYFNMLDMVDIAKKEHQDFINLFNFKYCANTQKEFDNLQDFINAAKKLL